MTNNQKNWLYVLAVIVAPFIVVHSFPTVPVARLLSIIWIFTIVPVIIIYVVVNPQTKILADTSRLNKTVDPMTLKRWTLFIKGVSALAVVGWLFYFTVPIWRGAYSVYVHGEPVTTVVDSDSNRSSAVLAPGIYYGVTLDENPSEGYMYLFPTIYRFGDSQYKFTVLTGTNIVLDVQPLTASSSI